MRRSGLKRQTELARTALARRDTPTRTRRGSNGISPASKAQRAKCHDVACLVCGEWGCEPAHVVSRAQGGCAAPECVVPLCHRDHRAYDLGALDLLPFLEPSWRDEQAHAVSHLGIARAYRRVTNDRGPS